MEENDIAFALYKASNAGVSVEMLVRGFCCLRPGVKGLSENIRVYSVIGRLLEHSRLLYFRNACENPLDGEFYLGSADLMYRNLHARVECIIPIYDPQVKAKLWEIISSYQADQRQTWDMDSNGEYKQRSGEELGVQQKLINSYKAAQSLIE